MLPAEYGRQATLSPRNSFPSRSEFRDRPRARASWGIMRNAGQGFLRCTYQARYTVQMQGHRDETGQNAMPPAWGTFDWA